MNSQEDQVLLENLGKIAYTLDRAYLAKLNTDYGVLPFEEYNKEGEAVSFDGNIRALRVTRCVLDKEEKANDCFKNVLGLFAHTGKTIALVLNRRQESTELFFVTRVLGEGRQNENSNNAIHALAGALRGNFPGTEISVIAKDEKCGRSAGENTEGLFDFDSFTDIAVMSNLPSEKSENYISQGIEKLINGVSVGSNDDEYTIIFLLESLTPADIRTILQGYEEIATAITPFKEYQFQHGDSITDTAGEMESTTHTAGMSYSVTKTHSVNVGANGSLFSSSSKSMNVGASMLGLLNVGVGLAKTKGRSVGITGGYGYSWGTTDTRDQHEAKTMGTNRSVSLGKSKSTTYTYKSYMVSNLIDKLQAIIMQLEQSKSAGLWKYAAYVLGNDPSVTGNVANTLRSLTEGDESHIAPSFIQNWQYQKSQDATAFDEIKKYISHFCHPVFANLRDQSDKEMIAVTPTIDVSTSSLSNVITFPKNSIPGLPVLECVRFGRDPHSVDSAQSIPGANGEALNDVALGRPYHMYTASGKGHIKLNGNELTKHTFITGSTGSGKSNTVYQLLDKLCFPENSDKNTVKFLVIEPAKGEYKDAFGGREDVSVYGTNPKKAPNLLQINPFSFPHEHIHVLEHVDRLVEVFNACWPMYAAMPAILKEAVEQTYEECGWNLRKSTCINSPETYPTFYDLLSKLPDVVDKSAYSTDTSSDYKGALVTRVRSLTRGIHGQIFASDTAPDILFNSNAIVDLSRIGSQETKALIMGILVLKLQEFRMAERDEAGPDALNSGLRHITVLEEAHNLLRRTSSEQSQESSNLQGKSVEMLANAIAEMRTYGEGFIIADQSPGLLDMSVIRNTNTKIIMRLPDEGDRILVGKAAGLNDAQIVELSRLEVGVAAVSQNNWLEPVLCKVDEFNDMMPLPNDFTPASKSILDEKSVAVQEFLSVALGLEQREMSKETVDRIKKWSNGLGLSKNAERAFRHVLDGGQLNDNQRVYVVAYAVGHDWLRERTHEKILQNIKRALSAKYDIEEDTMIVNRIMQLPLYELMTRHVEMKALQIEKEDSVR